MSKLYKTVAGSRRIASLLLAVNLILFSQLSAIAQQRQETGTQRENAIKLYQQGDPEGALKLLSSVVKNDKNDAIAWHYLGLALMTLKEVKKARNAFETATKISPDMGPAHTGFAYTLLLTDRVKDAKREARRAIELDKADAQAHYIIGVARLREGDHTEAELEANRAIELRPTFAPAFLLKSQAFLAAYASQAELLSRAHSPEELRNIRRIDKELIKRAAENLEMYLKQGPHPDSETWRNQLETLRAYVGTDGEVFRSSEVDTKVKILSKPVPGYTDEARQSGVSGKAVLRAVFSSRGTVEHILILRGLPYGLTEASVTAARGIKFVPARKGGKPVSTFMQLEYNFNLY